MYKKLSAIIFVAVMIVSLMACGEGNNSTPSSGNAEQNSSAPLESITDSSNSKSTSPTSDEKEKTENTAAEITIRQEDDNAVVILESELVKVFTDLAKTDKEAQFMMQFQDDIKNTAPTKGFSLSFDLAQEDEPFAFYHNVITDENYSIYDEGNKISIKLEDNKAIWTLSGIPIPLDGVEIVSVFILPSNNKFYGESEVPIADVKMENKINPDSEKAPESSSSVQEKVAPNYIGTYRQTSEWGNYVVVVEENSLTINDRYVAEMTETVMWTDGSGWYGELLITDTQTGAKGRDGAFQTHTRDEGMYFDISTFFPDTGEPLIISALKD